MRVKHHNNSNDSSEHLSNDLYHYTTIDAAKNIIKSEKFRATHYKCVNDLTECQHNIEVIPSIMKKYKMDKEDYWEDEEHAIIAHGLVKYPKKLFDNIGDELYLSCFSMHNKDNGYIRENGLLSLWRYYGKDGLALVIDKKKFETEFKKELKKRAKENKESYAVVANSTAYSGIDDDKISERTEQLIIGLKKHMKSGGKDSEEFIAAFLKLIFLTKHQSFKEEKEYRIGIVNRTLDTGTGEYGEPFKKVHYKNNVCRENKYINLSLPNGYIKEIIICPGMNKKYIEENLKEFLKQNKLINIKIRCLDIPHR